MRDKESFISPQLFFLLLAIIVIVAIAIRFVLPNSHGDTNVAQQQIAYYENLLFNRSVATNESVENTNVEKTAVGYLVSIHAEGYDMFFTTLSREFTAALPLDVIASGAQWVPGELWQKPVVITDRELITVKSITQGEKVTAQGVFATDLVSGEERELTRIPVEAHASQNGDVISSAGYDQENNSLTFIVDRDYSLSYDDAGSDFRQEIYTYHLKEDSRALLPIELKDSNHRIVGVHHSAGKTVFDFANGKEKNFQTSLGVLDDGAITETETDGRLIFFQEHGQSLYYTLETEDDLYIFYPLSQKGERVRDFTSASAWRDDPLVAGDDVPIVYYLELNEAAGVKKEAAYSRPIAGERPRGQVSIGYGRPKAFLGDSVLLLGKATDDRQYVSAVYNEVFGVLNVETHVFTELNNPKESAFIGVRKR